MISLHSVTKALFSKGEPPKLVLNPTTMSLPTDRRIAILGGRRQGKTLLLQLMLGMIAPDMGTVVAPLRMSPIANSRRLFYPLFSVEENIRLHARMFSLDSELLSRAMDELCGTGLLEQPVAKLGTAQRQQLEVALLSLLPFDCYFLDDASQVPRNWLEHYFYAAQMRGAGVIFTTTTAWQARQYADLAVVIRDSTVRAFNLVEEAIRSYERKTA